MNKELRAHLKKLQVVHFASSEYGQPRVRPVTLIYFDDKLFIATGSEDAKIKQVKHNNQVELCLTIKDEKSTGYIRFTGICTVIDDIQTKAYVMKEAEFIKQFWATADAPGFALLEITPEHAEYMPLGKMEAVHFEINN